MSLFHHDSPLMTALGKLSDIVICNLLFILCSLPVFTAGAALAALYTAMEAILDDYEDDPIYRVFLRAFKENFRQATLLWLVCLGAMAFLFLYYQVIALFEGTFFRVYQATFFLLCFLFAAGFQYIFPLQAQFANRVPATLKNSWLLAVLALPWTLLSLAIDAAVLGLFFLLNTNAVYMAIFLWSMFGFGLLCYLNSFVFRQAFKKIAPEHWAEKPDKGLAEGALFTDETHREDDRMVVDGASAASDWNRSEEVWGGRK